MVCVGLVALAYSVYLLYTGVPILMHIPEERGFIYASSVVTCGLILLVIILAATAILWTNGIVTPCLLKLFPFFPQAKKELSKLLFHVYQAKN